MRINGTIKAVPIGRQPREQPQSRLDRRPSKYIPKGRETTRLSKIFAIASACITAGEVGISRVQARKISGYAQSHQIDDMLQAGVERGFMFWEEEGESDYSPGRIGILSWPADFAPQLMEADHVANL